MNTQTNPLRSARKQRGMTLQEAAALVDTDIGNLSRIERGQLPSPKLAIRLSSAFGVSLDAIYRQSPPEQQAAP